MASDPTKLHPAVLLGLSEEDPTAVSRKQDHIELAFQSKVESGELDARFYYEPLLAAHPKPGSLAPFSFLGKTLRTPLWVSSMTGGGREFVAVETPSGRRCCVEASLICGELHAEINSISSRGTLRVLGVI